MFYLKREHVVNLHMVKIVCYQRETQMGGGLGEEKEIKMRHKTEMKQGTFWAIWMKRYMSYCPTMMAKIST